MKATTFLKAILLLIAVSLASPSPAATAPAETPVEQRVSHLKQRLEEIHAMDHSKLTRKEKKQLRGEVRAIKKEMAEISGGVYLSVGAIILIVLLILLLA